MSVKSSYIKRHASSLRDILLKTLKSQDEPERLSQEYAKAVQALDSLLKVTGEIYPSNESRKWYIYGLLNSEGLAEFQKLAGNTVSVSEASRRLCLNETIIRSIIHSSEYLVTVKARNGKSRPSLHISEKSLVSLQKLMAEDPLGEQFVTACYANMPKECRIEKSVACNDEKLDSVLKAYAE